MLTRKQQVLSALGALVVLATMSIGIGRSEDHVSPAEPRTADESVSTTTTASATSSATSDQEPRSTTTIPSSDEEASEVSKLAAQRKVRELLLKALASSTAATRLDVNLRLAEPYTQEPLSREAQRALIAQLQEPIVQLIEANGGTVTYRCQMLWCLGANIPASLVLDVASLPEVSIIDIDQMEVPDPE